MHGKQCRENAPYYNVSMAGTMIVK